MSEYDKLKYINSTNDLKNIDEFVEHILAEKNYNPRDSSFRFITSRRPDSSHIAFEFPGKYVETINTEVHTESGRNLEMDYAEVVLPNGIIKIKSNLNVEQQSELPDDDKIEVILYYAVDMTHKTNLPSVLAIMTHKDPKVKVRDYVIKGHVIRIYYIYVSAEKISKRLNTLEDLISNNKIMTEEEAMNFAYIAIFVDTDAKKIINRLAELFKQVPYLEFELKHDLHHVLKKMIKYHFQNDRNKAKELLYMITQTLTQKEFQELSSYDKALYQIDVMEEKNKESQKLLHQKDEELHQKDVELQQKDEIIQDLQNRLYELGK